MNRHRTLTLTPASTPPPIPDGVDWPLSVRLWWTTIWSTPVAAEWDVEVDLAAVKRLASIYAALEVEPSAALHAQAARLETELMLTPLARRRAYVRLERDDVEPEAPRVRRPAPKVDPRRLLCE